MNNNISQQKKQTYITENGLSIAPGDPPKPAEIAHCENWLDTFATPQKSINRRAFSYSLKHRAESWNYTRVHEYVSNDAFIQAALNRGYKLQPCGSPNV